MCQIFLLKATFHLFLIQIDQELASTIRSQGCLCCGGKLHAADYPRSPVGIPSQFRQYYDDRLSFCCAKCRHRVTPPSVRFFGRRWYPAPLHLLVSVLMCGISERRLSQVKRHFGITVNESTWKRWRKWWNNAFEETAFWRKEKGLMPNAGITDTPFPRALLNEFHGTLKEKLAFLCRFLSPLTGSILRAV